MVPVEAERYLAAASVLTHPVNRIVRYWLCVMGDMVSAVDLTPATSCSPPLVRGLAWHEPHHLNCPDQLVIATPRVYKPLGC